MKNNKCYTKVIKNNILRYFCIILSYYLLNGCSFFLFCFVLGFLLRTSVYPTNIVCMELQVDRLYYMKDVRMRCHNVMKMACHDKMYGSCNCKLQSKAIHHCNRCKNENL